MIFQVILSFTSAKDALDMQDKIGKAFGMVPTVEAVEPQGGTT